MACAARCRRRDAGAGRMTTDAPIPADATTRREAAVWIAAAVATLAIRSVARFARWMWRTNAEWWTGTGVRWRTVAFLVFFLVLGAWLGRAARQAVDLLTVGAEHVNAASADNQKASGAAPHADPALQSGYADPAAGEDDRAAVDDPMVPLVPDAPMQEYAAPGGPDDGTPPTWLPEGLAPWWLDIVAAAHENGLDSHAWAAIVAQENPWGQPWRTSPAGARGLAQLMPLTAADIAGQTGIDVTTPTGNLRGGAWYFAARVRDNGDLWTAGDDLPTLLAAAAAYNGGGPPSQDVRAAAMAGASDLCAGVRYAETKRYCYAYADRWEQTQAERAGATLEAMADER